MRKTAYFIIIVNIFFCQCSGQNEEENQQDSNEISIGVRDHVYSEILNENRQVWVHVPESSIDGRKFPVIYLLDGEYHFESVTGIVKISVINHLMPEVIIVAIPNTNRYRDLTTSHIGDDPNPSGGAGKFTQFIEQELIPYIDHKYPTISHRTIVGHSLGGLVVANILIKHPHIFNNYLAIDPSLSWDEKKLINEAKPLIRDNKYDHHSIYIAVANTINNNHIEDAMSFEKAMTDTTTATLHLRSIIEFSELLKVNDQLISSWKYYPDETHGTIPVVALHEAIRTLFSWYKFEHWDEFYKPEPNLTGEELVNLIITHHEKISVQLGHTQLPDRNEINRLGYMFLDKDDYKRALPFFQLNVRNYPNSSNVHDSIGDYYNRISDKDNALKHYSKAVELGGSDGMRVKLDVLMNEKDK